VLKTERDGITVEAALTWNDGYHETVLCFTNKHAAARRRRAPRRLPRPALTRQVTGYATRAASCKGEVALTGDDCREGLTAVLFLAKVPDPKFSSQTKDKLVSSEVRPVVEGIVTRRCSTGSKSIRRSKTIVGKVIQLRRARSSPQGARE